MPDFAATYPVVDVDIPDYFYQWQISFLQRDIPSYALMTAMVEFNVLKNICIIFHLY